MDSLKGTLTPMKVLQGTLNGGIAYGTFNYNELENKPSVNGTELVGNVNIPIPTKTSDLTNDSGFITSANVPTKTSDLTNDSGFITSADIPTKTSELTNDSGFITSADIPTIPTNTSQLNNDSGFLTMLTTPVRSVNSQTGDVNLFIPNATSQLNNDAGFLTDNTVPVKSVNDQTGNIELTADNIPYDNENSIAEAIQYNNGDSITASITKLCAGRSTSAGDKVVFFYPLPKIIKTTSATLIISANTAYAWRTDGGPVALTAGTYNASVSDGGLYIIANLSSTVTGNRSINVELSNRTIKFLNQGG